MYQNERERSYIHPLALSDWRNRHIGNNTHKQYHSPQPWKIKYKELADLHHKMLSFKLKVNRIFSANLQYVYNSNPTPHRNIDYFYERCHTCRYKYSKNNIMSRLKLLKSALHSSVFLNIWHRFIYNYEEKHGKGHHSSCFFACSKHHKPEQHQYIFSCQISTQYIYKHNRQRILHMYRCRQPKKNRMNRHNEGCYRTDIVLFLRKYHLKYMEQADCRSRPHHHIWILKSHGIGNI